MSKEKAVMQEETQEYIAQRRVDCSLAADLVSAPSHGLYMSQKSLISLGRVILRLIGEIDELKGE